MATVIDELVVLLGLKTDDFKKDTREAGESLKKFKDETEKHGKDVNKNVKDMTDSFNGVVKALGQMTAGYLTVSGITSFISNTTQANVATGQLATTLGTTVEKLAQYRQAATLAGIDPNSMQSSIQGVTNNLTNYSLGRANDSFLTAAARLGINYLGPDGRPVDFDTFLRRSQQASQRALKSGQYTAPQVTSLLRDMGIDEQTAYVIESTSGALEKFLEASGRIGATTGQQSESSRVLTREWNNLGTSASHLGRAIMEDLNGPLGSLLRVLKNITEWFDNHRKIFEVLAGIVSGAITGSLVGAGVGTLLGPGGTAFGAVAGAVAGSVQGGIIGAGLPRASSQPPPNASGAVGVGGSATLQQERAWMAEEIRKDPKLAADLRGLAVAEDAVDPAGPIKSLANRAAYLRQHGWRGTIRDLIGTPGNSRFYGPMQRGQVQPNNSQKVQDAIDSVWAGSNRLQGATDQGSAGDPNAGWMGGRILPPGAPRGAIYNDWGGGPGGHEGARQFREDQQRRINNSNSIISPQAPPPAGETWYERYWKNLQGGWGRLHNQSNNSTTNNHQSTSSIHVENINVATAAKNAYDLTDGLAEHMRTRFSLVQGNTGIV